MKGSEQKPPLLPLFAGLLAFFLMSGWSLWWFVSHFSQLTGQVVSNARLIDFNKGSFYGLGGGISIAALTYIMILLPHIAHYSIEYILEKRGYMICDTHSVQWSMYRSYYYVSDVDTCTNLIESKNN